jgi:hypothetical protein
VQGEHTVQQEQLSQLEQPEQEEQEQSGDMLLGLLLMKDWFEELIFDV